MNNIVTFETAKRLKEAGFPQPTPEAGQFWYSPDEATYCVQFARSGIASMQTIGRRSHGFETLLLGWIFAPTATDILLELAMSVWDTHIVRVDVSTFNTGDNAKTWVRLFPTTETESTFEDNPAAAAAAAWLDRNKQGEP